MDKILYYLLGTVFIIAGGITYTLERGIAHLVWIGQLNAIRYMGSAPNSPQIPGLFTNVFVPLFMIIGIFFFVLAFYKHNRKI